MTTPTGNGAVLTAHEATIQTASVEIHTLRVGKKQVTMGMFRQLPVKHLVDWWRILEAEEYGQWEDASPLHLQGMPWGHVNYWWTDNDRENKDYLTERGTLQPLRGPRLHLVWQDAAALYRDIVYLGTPKGILGYVESEERGAIPILQHRSREITRWWQQIWAELEALPQLFIAV